MGNGTKTSRGAGPVKSWTQEPMRAVSGRITLSCEAALKKLLTGESEKCQKNHNILGLNLNLIQ